MKGSKRYGRRSAPEVIHAHTESHRQAEDENEKDEDAQTGDDRTVPRKREVTHTQRDHACDVRTHSSILVLMESFISEYSDNNEGWLKKQSKLWHSKIPNPKMPQSWRVYVCLLPSALTEVNEISKS